MWHSLLDFLGRLAYSSRAMAETEGERRTPYQRFVANLQAVFAFAGQTAKKIGTDGFVIIGSLAVIAVYVGFVMYLWRQEFFEVPDGDAGPEVVAAVVALLGGLFAALLTFAGVMLKHSLDTRAEERLKLDTFIRAAGLLATDAGTPSPPTQQAAALFVLADLGHLNFALALLGEIWKEGEISPSSACWLIDKCLKSEDDILQIDAANTLQANAGDLWKVECFAWPEALVDAWPESLPLTARYLILRALLTCLLSRPTHEWRPGCLSTFVVHLARIKNQERDRMLRAGTVLLLDAILSSGNLFGPEGVLTLGRETVNLETLRLEVRELAKDTGLHTYDQILETLVELQVWLDKPPPDAPRPAVVDGG